MAEKKKGCGCLSFLMAGFGILILAAVFRPSAHNPPTTGVQTSETKDLDKAIPYEVLRKEKRRGKLSLEILVGEADSKQNVLKLAENLRREHDGKFALISIFDSRDAWKHRPAMERAALQGKSYKSYPEKELDRHWLVVIDDIDHEIRWVAEGRDH